MFDFKKNIFKLYSTIINNYHKRIIHAYMNKTSSYNFISEFCLL